METWVCYDKIDVDIEWIQQFCGGDGECSLFFLDRGGRKGRLRFPGVYDFRYAIENAFIGRSMNLSGNKDTGFDIVEDSEYIKYFERQAGDTIPTDDVRHYVVFDKTDTGIEILACGEPSLTWLDEDEVANGSE